MKFYLGQVYLNLLLLYTTSLHYPFKVWSRWKRKTRKAEIYTESGIQWERFLWIYHCSWVKMSQYTEVIVQNDILVVSYFYAKTNF